MHVYHVIWMVTHNKSESLCAEWRNSVNGVIISTGTDSFGFTSLSLHGLTFLSNVVELARQQRVTKLIWVNPVNVFQLMIQFHFVR